MRMNKSPKLLLLTSSLLLVCFVVFSLGLAQGTEEKPEHGLTQTPVKIAPGGTIEISLAVTLPKGYELSEDPALTVNLDKKSLKAKKLTSEKYQYVFKAKELGTVEHEKSVEQKPPDKPASLTLKVSKYARTRKISIPIKFGLFFCSKENGYCTNAELVRNLELVITREKGTPSSVEYLLELAPTKEELGI